MHLDEWLPSQIVQICPASGTAMSDPFRALLLVPEVKTRLAELVSALCNPATRRLPTYWALRYLALELVLTFRCLFSPPSLFCIKKIFAQSDGLVSFPEKNPVVRKEPCSCASGPGARCATHRSRAVDHRLCLVCLDLVDRQNDRLSHCLQVR